MTVTFDTFSKKTRLYYISLIVSIITLSTLLLCWKFNLQGETLLFHLLWTLLILGIVVGFITMFIIIPGVIKTYIKDGELTLADDHLIINGVKLLLNETKEIRLKVGYWNIKKYGRIMSNRITVIDKNDKSYNCRFVIASRDNNQEFDSVIKTWNDVGLTFGFKYHDVL